MKKERKERVMHRHEPLQNWRQTVHISCTGVLNKYMVGCTGVKVLVGQLPLFSKISYYMKGMEFTIKCHNLLENMLN